MPFFPAQRSNSNNLGLLWNVYSDLWGPGKQQREQQMDLQQQANTRAEAANAREAEAQPLHIQSLKTAADEAARNAARSQALEQVGQAPAGQLPNIPFLPQGVTDDINTGLAKTATDTLDSLKSTPFENLTKEGKAFITSAARNTFPDLSDADIAPRWNMIVGANTGKAGLLAKNVTSEGGKVVAQYTAPEELSDRQVIDPATGKPVGLWVGGKHFLPLPAPGSVPTEQQANAQQFASRMAFNNAIFEAAPGEKDTHLTTAAAKSILPKALWGMVDKNLPSREAAKQNWMAAMLRKESGAAISKTEYSDADRQYFPQAGDSAEVIKQKSALRQLAEKNMLQVAGPGSATAPANAQQALQAIGTLPLVSAPAVPGAAPGAPEPAFFQSEAALRAANPPPGSVVKFDNGKGRILTVRWKGNAAPAPVQGPSPIPLLSAPQTGPIFNPNSPQIPVPFTFPQVNLPFVR